MGFLHLGFLIYKLIHIGFLTVGFLRLAFDLLPIDNSATATFSELKSRQSLKGIKTSSKIM
jgi:hypothetical protein